MWTAASNAWAERWLDLMIPAAWQGAAALAVVWAAAMAMGCRRKRGGARVECWLWRAGYLKFLMCLLGISPMVLAVLPAKHHEAAAVMRDGGTMTASMNPAPIAETPAPAIAAAAKMDATAADIHTGAPDLHPGAAVTVPVHEAAPLVTWKAWLMLAWLAGLAFITIRTALAWGRTWRLKHNARPMSGTAGQWYAGLGRRMGIAHMPVLLESDSLNSPVLVGTFRPLIVLPAGMAETWGRTRVEMILAHELAHWRRRDLSWNWLHALVEGLFFFNPALWLSRRAWRGAREIACDEEAVAASGMAAEVYGNTLVEVIAGARAHETRILGVGVAESFADIQRRLRAMTRQGTWTKRRWAAMSMAAIVLGMAGLTPWRLTAQTPPAASAGNGPIAAAKPSQPPAGAEFTSTLPSRDLTPEQIGKRDPLMVELLQQRSVIQGALEGLKKQSPDGADPQIAEHEDALAKLNAQIQNRAEEFNDMLQNVHVVGWLSAPTIEVRAPVDGTLMGVLAAEGKTVAEGDKMFYFDSSEEQVSLRLEMINLERCRGKLDVLQKSAATAGYTQAEKVAAESDLKQEEILVSLREAEVNKRTITAPMGGIVDALAVKNREYVAKGTVLAKLVDLSKIQVQLDVMTNAVVKVGDKIKVWVPDLNESAPATVSYVGATVDSQTNMVRVQAVLDRIPERFKPGMQAKVSLPVWGKTGG